MIAIASILFFSLFTLFFSKQGRDNQQCTYIIAFLKWEFLCSGFLEMELLHQIWRNRVRVILQCNKWPCYFRERCKFKMTETFLTPLIFLSPNSLLGWGTQKHKYFHSGSQVTHGTWGWHVRVGRWLQGVGADLPEVRNTMLAERRGAGRKPSHGKDQESPQNWVRAAWDSGTRRSGRRAEI